MYNVRRGHALILYGLRQRSFLDVEEVGLELLCGRCAEKLREREKETSAVSICPVAVREVGKGTHDGVSSLSREGAVVGDPSESDLSQRQSFSVRHLHVRKKS